MQVLQFYLQSLVNRYTYQLFLTNIWHSNIMNIVCVWTFKGVVGMYDNSPYRKQGTED